MSRSVTHVDDERRNLFEYFDLRRKKILRSEIFFDIYPFKFYFLRPNGGPYADPRSSMADKRYTSFVALPAFASPLSEANSVKFPSFKDGASKEKRLITVFQSVAS